MRTVRASLVVMAVCLVGAFVAAPAVGQATQPGTITEFPTPANSQPVGIVQGPDGAMWITANDADRVFRMTTDGQITNTFPSSGDALNQPNFITVGPDGNLWLTEDDDMDSGGNAIARLTPAGVSTVFPLPNNLSAPQGIVLGPDGKLWFAEFGTGGNRIGSIDPSAPNPGATIQEYNLAAGAGPFGITVGPDGLIWFTEELGNAIGHLDPSAANVQASLVEIPLPAGQSNPTGIVTGPDGKLWFTLQNSARIGTITTAGAIGGFDLPQPGPTEPTGITAGPDGALWYALSGQPAAIGRITTTGEITSAALPVATSDPFVVNPGPGSTLWFTEIALGGNGDRVGRISDIVQPTPPPAPTPTPVVVQPTFTG